MSFFGRKIFLRSFICLDVWFDVKEKKLEFRSIVSFFLRLSEQDVWMDEIIFRGRKKTLGYGKKIGFIEENR